LQVGDGRKEVHAKALRSKKSERGGWKALPIQRGAGGLKRGVQFAKALQKGVLVSRDDEKGEGGEHQKIQKSHRGYVPIFCWGGCRGCDNLSSNCAQWEREGKKWAHRQNIMGGLRLPEVHQKRPEPNAESRGKDDRIIKVIYLEEKFWGKGPK